MPHDKNGQVIEVGDEVMVPAVVKQVMTGEDYCNVTLETTEPMYPGEHKSGMTLNARQVVKVSKHDANLGAVER